MGCDFSDRHTYRKKEGVFDRDVLRNIPSLPTALLPVFQCLLMGAEVITYLEDMTEIQRTTMGEILPSTGHPSSLGHCFTYGVVGRIINKKKVLPLSPTG